MKLPAARRNSVELAWRGVEESLRKERMRSRAVKLSFWTLRM